MRVYAVSYDLNKPGQDYSSLIAELEASPGWWHYLKSTWLIATNESVQQLAGRLLQRIDKDDSLLVIEVLNNKAGWLPQKAWDWINRQLRMAA